MPSPNPYVSKLWDDRKLQAATVGDVRGKIKWDNGANLTGLIGVAHCGSDQAWHEGAVRGRDHTCFTDASGVCPCCLPVFNSTGGAGLGGTSQFGPHTGGFLIGGSIYDSYAGGFTVGGFTSETWDGEFLVSGTVTTQPASWDGGFVVGGTTADLITPLVGGFVVGGSVTDALGGGFVVGGSSTVALDGGFVVGGSSTVALDGGFRVGGSWATGYSGGFLIAGSAYQSFVTFSGGFLVGGNTYQLPASHTGGFLVGGKIAALYRGGFLVGGKIAALYRGGFLVGGNVRGIDVFIGGHRNDGPVLNQFRGGDVIGGKMVDVVTGGFPSSGILHAHLSGGPTLWGVVNQISPPLDVITGGFLIGGKETEYMIFPERATLWADEAFVTSGPGLNPAVNTTKNYCMYVFQAAAPNIGDAWEWSCLLKAGSYGLFYLVTTEPDAGFFDVYVDGVVVASGIDCYSAGAFPNQYLSSVITVVGDGRHVVKLVITGRNPSSSNYYFTLTKLYIVPVGGDTTELV